MSDAGVPQYPEHLRALVDAYLSDLDFSPPPGAEGLRDSMLYSLLAGGKRVRPVLLLATVESRGRAPQSALPAAAAFELIHTYSLIHDDLPAMDDDDLRRGRPTNHVQFGEDVAILAGDALYAEAVSLVVRRQAAEPHVLVAVLGEMSRATGVGGMVGGQYMDVAAGGPGEVRLEEMHALKTGRLIEASVVCGALLSAAAPHEVPLYRAYAAEIGLLFQIVDDILDVVGEQGQLGKTVGKDAASDKLTYVSQYGLERARALAGECCERALDRLDRLPGEPSSLRALTLHIHSRQS
jgi:geranylgeranyl diphosphate synthase, type II